MKALDQRLFPKLSLCKVFIHAKNSCERPTALLVPSQLVRGTEPATVSGNTWALLLTVLLSIHDRAIAGGTQHPTDICVQCWGQHTSVDLSLPSPTEILSKPQFCFCPFYSHTFLAALSAQWYPECHWISVLLNKAIPVPWSGLLFQQSFPDFCYIDTQSLCTGTACEAFAQPQRCQTGGF